MATTSPILLIAGDHAGDHISENDSGEPVLTISQFIDELWQGVYSLDSRPIRLQLDEDVDDEDWNRIHDQARLLGLANRLDVQQREPALAAAPEAARR